MNSDEIQVSNRDWFVLPHGINAVWETYEPPFIVVPLDCFDCTTNKQLRKELNEVLQKYFDPSNFKL